MKIASLIILLLRITYSNAQPALKATTEQHKIKSGSEMIHACQPPGNALKNATTEGLLDTYPNYHFSNHYVKK